MNRIVASVGLVALGAATVQAQSTVTGRNAAVTGPAPKWWSVSATVRGFYDDNPNTAPDGSPEKFGVWGYELSPSVGLSLGNQQTTFTASYIFDYIYYDKSLSTTVNPQNGVPSGTTKNDQDHTFTAALDHAFSERYSVHVADSFVIGQQPDQLRVGNSITFFQRIPGNNIVNSGTIILNGELTPTLGFEAGYNNGLYDYSAEELSGPLNRVENYAHFDLRWNMAHDTVGVLGYQFGAIAYTGSGPFANPFGIQETPANPLPAINVRDTLSHTIYVGADHSFSPNLIGSLRAGASYYDYYHDSSASDFGPYAVASLTYVYAPESTFGIGFQEQRQASSLTGVQNGNNNSFVHDTETSVVYASLVHRIVPKLFGSIRGTFQDSIYHGGGPGINGLSDRFYEAEVDLEYRFCPNFSVHGGYDYNNLDSRLSQKVAGDRSYDRNRFYIGATASY